MNSFANLILTIFIAKTFCDLDSTFSRGKNEEGGVESTDWPWSCRPRHYPDQSSFVCVCDENYCDRPEPLGLAANDSQTLVYYVTDSAQLRLSRRVARFENKLEEAKKSYDEPSFSQENTSSKYKIAVTIDVDPANSSQKILGFGGAFTDAVGINLMKLTPGTRDQLIRTYFHVDQGIGYTLGRVPIASCDFSTREYSYLEKENDFEAETFSLASEDFEYKIPFIQAAKAASANRLNLISSSWSAPGWMKSTRRMHRGGRLMGEFNGKYYKTYAKYFQRFFGEYAKHNITFWGTTIQNEPSAVLPWQTMYFNSTMQRDFAIQLLAPALQSEPASQTTKILAFDDQRGNVYEAAMEIFGENSTENPVPEIAGLATHWYDFSGYDVLSRAHNLRPDKLILATEACTGYAPWQHKVLLGDWLRGVEYAHDILNSLRNWVVGWTDWNLALDFQGGPNWVQNFVDAPIIVNASAGNEFLKQPMFYAMAHFSQFVSPGSMRTESRAGPGTSIPTTFEHVAFKTPDGRRVLVLVNNAQFREVEVTVRDLRARKTAKFVVPPDSFITATWQK